MRQLLGFLLTVIVAVAVTLFAQGNAAKVAIFVGQKRIDLGLNFAIILLCVSFFFVHFSLLAIRVSGQLPSRFKTFFANRNQSALLQANTHGLIALIAGDEQGSEKALKLAIKTGMATDLSYFIRAMSCIESGRFDEAERVLDYDKAKVGENTLALILLRTKIALAKRNYAQALEALQDIDVTLSRLPSVNKLRLFALIGLSQWTEALTAYQACSSQLSQVEFAQALGVLTDDLTGVVLFVEKLLSQHPDDCRLIELAKKLSCGKANRMLFNT